MQLIIRRASVECVAGGRGGRSAMTTESGALARVPFSLGEGARRNSDTNPGELIAAAHAGSFALALRSELGRTALSAGELLVSAAVTLQHSAAGWTITNIHLTVVARLPRLSHSEFIDATVRAKTSCLVSRALRSPVSMNAKLEKTAARQTLCKATPSTRRLVRRRPSRKR